MSKLIVEMDMPERCAECRVRLSCKWFIYNFLYSNSTEYLKPQIGDPKCLIKGVLPDEYGDLIDRDELKKQCWHDDGFEMWVSHAEIDQQPTVVAAERKDER